MLAFEHVPIECFATPITVTVVGDTHLRTSLRPLPNPLVESLRASDLILHTGDFVSAEVLEVFEQLAPVRAVFGNNDDLQLLASLPEIRLFQFGRFRAGMIHGHNLPGKTARQVASTILGGRVDLAIFGHSHQPVNQWQEGWLLFNPGSPTDRRRQPRFSFGVLTISDELGAELRYF